MFPYPRDLNPIVSIFLNMSFNLEYLEKPKLKKPAVIAGLPGIAYIGKLAVEFLIRELKARKFAELYTEYFPGWVIREGGTIRELKVDFYSSRPKDLKRDLILVTADAQAASSFGQYELSDKIVEIVSRHKADTLATMAAYLSPFEENLRVVGAASDPKTAELLEKHNIKLLDGGMIVGMNGLLVALAGERNLRSFCLLGTTQGGMLDTEASEAVLRALMDILGFWVDLSNLKEYAPRLPKIKPPRFMLPEIGEEETSYIR